MHPPSKPATSALVAFFAVATILLPAHPSLQSLFHQSGIPAALVSAACAVPVLFVFGRRRLFDRQALLVAGCLAAYSLWMGFRALTSPAFGMSNQLESLRSLLVLVPLSFSAALVATGNQRAAAASVAILGAAAAVHFSCLMLLGGDSVLASSGFRDLSGDDASENYQATAFYFGFLAIALAVSALHGRRGWRWISMAALLPLIGLMACVGARAGLLALAMVLMALLCRAGLVRAAAFVIVASALGVATVIGADALGVLSVEDLLQSLVAVRRFAILAQGGDPSQRIGLFAAALRLWLESPATLLFGAGLGDFPLTIGRGIQGCYPHNFVLETLAEGGLVGLLPLIVMITMVLRRFWREALPTAHGPRYLGALAVYALLTHQFMRGIQSVWVPTFFMALFICVTRPSELRQDAYSARDRGFQMPPTIVRAPAAPARG